MIERKFELEMRELLTPIYVDLRLTTLPALLSPRHSLFFVSIRRLTQEKCVCNCRTLREVEDLIYAEYCRVYEEGQWFEGDSELVFGSLPPMRLAAE